MSTLTPERVHAALFQLAIHEVPAGPLRSLIGACIDWPACIDEGEPLPHEVVAARTASGLLMTPPSGGNIISDDSRRTLALMAIRIAEVSCLYALAGHANAPDLWTIAATLAGFPDHTAKAQRIVDDVENRLREVIAERDAHEAHITNLQRKVDRVQLERDAAIANSETLGTATTLARLALRGFNLDGKDIAAGIRQLGAREAAAKAELAEAKATRSFNGLQVQLHAANERVKEAEARAERAEAALADLRKARGTLPAAQRIRVAALEDLLKEAKDELSTRKWLETAAEVMTLRKRAEDAETVRDEMTREAMDLAGRLVKIREVAAGSGREDKAPTPAAPSKPQPGDRVPWAEVEDGCLYKDDDAGFLLRHNGRHRWVFVPEARLIIDLVRDGDGWIDEPQSQGAAGKTGVLVARDLGTDPEAWRAAMREHLAKQKA